MHFFSIPRNGSRDFSEQALFASEGPFLVVTDFGMILFPLTSAAVSDGLFNNPRVK